MTGNSFQNKQGGQPNRSAVRAVFTRVNFGDVKASNLFMACQEPGCMANFVGRNTTRRCGWAGWNNRPVTNIHVQINMDWPSS